MNKFYVSAIDARTLLLLLIATVSLFTSCSTNKDIPYVQDFDRSAVSKSAIENYSPLLIQPGDQLSINVSSKNPQASAVFNNNHQNAGDNPNNPTYGYLVSSAGQINLPLLGPTNVTGMKTEPLAEELRKQLLPFLREPTVTVQIVNFKISVLGDVQRPNIYTSSSERFTVAEALSLAGDLNITALRKTVVLVREENGERIFVPLDLTSKKLFESPYFYLKTNDLLIVEPSKLKIAAADTGYRNASLIISALSVIAITLSFLR